jgi:hypothetical protein
MFRPQLFDTVPLVEHLHADGTSSQMEIEPTPGDAAEYDPERAWATGRIYVCPSCAERVRVELPPSKQLPEGI